MGQQEEFRDGDCNRGGIKRMSDIFLFLIKTN
jgi:hypothetical protein